MKLFVASPVEIYEGDAAQAKLAAVNDARFASANGILAVDDVRWQTAQAYERETWLTYNRGAVTDRNEDHAKAFADYQALPPDLGDYLEIGCGPFTNARFILREHTAATITLLDPLLWDYEREHPNCAYKEWHLDGQSVIPVAQQAEGWRLPIGYDTVVLINVLSHCQDALAVLDTIRAVLKVGGYLVFHECANHTAPDELYDAGHPLVIGQAVIDQFLDGYEPIYRSGHYFIGRLT